MAISGLSLRNNLVRLWFGHFCLPMWTVWENSLLALLARRPFPAGKLFFPVWTNSCRPRAVSIASLLMGECGLSHERVEDGCRSTCVKFGGWKSDRTGLVQPHQFYASDVCYETLAYKKTTLIAEVWFKDLYQTMGSWDTMNFYLTLMSVHFKLVNWNTSLAPCSKLYVTLSPSLPFVPHHSRIGFNSYLQLFLCS